MSTRTLHTSVSQRRTTCLIEAPLVRRRGIVAAAISSAFLFLFFFAPSIARAQGCSTADPAVNAADPSALAWNSDQAIQTNFTSARANEGCSTPLTLPPGFDGMSAQQQMLSLFNSERTARGLPVLQLDSTLASQIALNHNKEMVQYGYFNHSSPINLNFSLRLTVNPALAYPKSTGTGENIAAGVPNAAAAVYSYMYFDGPGARNGACQGTVTWGCWGHRHSVLGNFNWVGIGVTLNATGSQWTNYYTDDFLNMASGYAPPATADTNPPLMGQISYSGGNATVTGVAVNPMNVNNTGANPATAGITQVVFYVNRINANADGSYNTVVATETAPGSRTWAANIVVNPGDVLHAVAVDGSGNYTDMTLSSPPG